MALEIVTKQRSRSVGTVLRHLVEKTRPYTSLGSLCALGAILGFELQTRSVQSEILRQLTALKAAAERAPMTAAVAESDRMLAIRQRWDDVGATIDVLNQSLSSGAMDEKLRERAKAAIAQGKRAYDAYLMEAFNNQIAKQVVEAHRALTDIIDELEPPETPLGP